MRLTNKVAIITGGGSGFGKAASILFSMEGAKIVVAQRTETTGKKTVNYVKKQGGDAIFIRTDVTSASDVEKMVKTTVDKYGKIDILFNNAGVSGKGIVEDFDEAEWDKMYATNVKSVFLGAKYAVPFMKKAGSGVIINTASIGAVRPRMGTTAYASSKGAVIILTKALALELAPFNIRVNCINPVASDTPMMRGLSVHAPSWEDFKAGTLSTIPMGRLATPDDIAYAALYLASDEASIVTGACLDVDGGRGI